MKKILLLVFWMMGATAFGQLPDSTIRQLKTGRIGRDTSFVYWLPYPSSSKHLLIQGYNSKLSHTRELSLDFKMKKGSKICAARSGKVISVKSDSDEGGLEPEMMSKGNHIIIQHNDGSVAYYWHLQKNGVLVQIADSVTQGQLIGLSGNTGYTAFAHLHFQVQDASGHDVATRFLTRKGIRYLRPMRWYKGFRP